MMSCWMRVLCACGLCASGLQQRQLRWRVDTARRSSEGGLQRTWLGSWEELLPELEVPQVAVSAIIAPVVEEAVHLEVASSGGAASSNEPAPGPVDAPAALVPRPAVRDRDRWLEGVKAKIDAQPGKYARVIVRCPVHRKPPCEAQRSFSNYFARKSGCGVEEPFCCLGVWLRRAREFDTAEKHKALKQQISVQEMRAFAVEHDWPLTDPDPNV